MINRYNDQHQASLIRCYIEAFAGPPWFDRWEESWVKARLEWLTEVPNFSGWVALQEGQVIGALLGYAKPYKQRLDFEVLELFVAPEQQGRGIGRLLMSALEESLPQGSGTVIHLLTARDTKSEVFYEKSGFNRKERLGFMTKEVL